MTLYIMRRSAVLCLVLLFTSTIFAQITDIDAMQIRISGTNQVFDEGLCGFWQYPNSLAEIDAEFCAPLVWAYDITGDSLCCDSIANDYTGKVVLIRRGACEFCRKNFMAERAGAVAVIIVNHYNNAQDNGCSVPTGICELPVPLNIPMFSASRVMGEALIAAMEANGGQTEICLDFVQMLEPRDAYHYFTPASQVDSLKHISIRCINRGPDTTNVTFTVNILRPDGLSDSLTVLVDSLESDSDLRIVFPPYLPPSIEGIFKLTFTSSLFTETRDMIRSQFRQVPYTFGTDTGDLISGGIGMSDQAFAASEFAFETASLYFSGSAGAKVNYASFGIANTAQIFTPDPAANVIGVTLYDADSDDDGIIDLGSGFNDLEQGIIATGEYIVNCVHSNNNALVDVPLTDVLTGNFGVDLKPSHPYYLSLIYSGLAAGTGHCPRYVATTVHNYDPFPSTPSVIAGNLQDGFAEGEIILRLSMEGFSPSPDPSCLPNSTSNVLDATRYKISPNPGSDRVILDLNLAQINSKVTVSLVSPKGKILDTKVREKFQEGQLVFDAKALPSGAYMLWIRTEEGNVMAKVVLR